MGHAELPNQSKQQKRGLFGFVRRSTGWLFSQRHFHFQVLSGTAAGVTGLVLLAGIFLYVTLQNHYQDVMRAHSIEVMRWSNVIENDIAGLETTHRGLLLTDNSSYAASFNERRISIKNRIEALTDLVKDNPKQRKPIMKAQEVVQNWIDTIALPEIEAHRKATPESTT